MTLANPTNLAVLERVLAPGAVITDPDRMAGYRWDRANDPNAGTPLAVMRVESTEDVQSVMRFADQHEIPVVVRGAGTGLSGGSSAIDGCIVVSTERMTAIEIDPDTRTAIVEPGLLNVQVKAAAAEHGLWYPPDPSSYEICSIGGNIATNAGGLCCVKYGVTTDYVLGLTVVLADGTKVELGGKRLKDVAGLPLTKLFVGSEGTLGIVTKIVLRLIPKQRNPATVVATFASVEDACSAVVEMCRDMRPSMLELMDKTTINAVEDATSMGLDRAAEAMLVIQSDEPGEHAGVDAEAIADWCTRNRASEVYSTSDPEESEAFVVARRIAIPAVERKGALLLEDVGVPVPLLSQLVRGIADIAEKNRITVAVMAHAGDGNTHPLIVHDPMDAQEKARAEQAYSEIMMLAISLGGTITGEHGVGRLKRAWLPDYLGPDELALNHRIKNALDPKNLLNPGSGI